MISKELTDSSNTEISLIIDIDPTILITQLQAFAKGNGLKTNIDYFGNSYLLELVIMQVDSISIVREEQYELAFDLKYELKMLSSAVTVGHGLMNVDIHLKAKLEGSFDLACEINELNVQHLEGPYLKLRNRDIRVRSLAKLILKLNKNKIISQIEHQLNQVDLRAEILNSIEPYLETREIAENIWLHIEPELIDVGGIDQLIRHGNGRIDIYAKTFLIGQSEKPIKRVDYNIRFQNMEFPVANELSAIPVITQVDYETLKLYLNKKLKSLPIDKYGQHIYVSIIDIALLHNEGRIRLIGNILGSLTGKIVLEGLLNLDEDQQIVNFDIADLTLDLDSGILQSGANLFRNFIRKRIAELLIIDFKPIVRSQLEKFNSEFGETTKIGGSMFNMNVSMNNVKLADLRVKSIGLEFCCLIEGKMSLVDCVE